MPIIKVIPTLILFSFLGCKDKETILEPVQTGIPFEIPAWQYATNHFFIDTLYISHYDQTMQNPSTPLHPEYTVKWIQVWKLLSVLADPNAVWIRAFITCPPLNSASYNSMRTGGSVAGTIDAGIFTPLDSSKYSYNAITGTLAIFDTTITSDISIAVAYEREDGSQFGETPFMVPHDSMQIREPMILKLVKPRLAPHVGSIAWMLQMKNVYSIGKTEISQSGFSVDVFRNFQNGRQTDSILSVPLLRVIGLDKVNGNGTLGPDGIFDFLPGVTIDKLHGEIIFPNVRPFDDGIRNYFKSIGQSLPSNSQYTFPALYDTTMLGAMNLANSSYVIRGRTGN